MNGQRCLSLVAIILASLTLVAVIADAVILLGNQKIEIDVQGRQQIINQTTQINQIGNALIQALGAAAVNGNDTAARNLLSEFGLSIVPGSVAQPPKTP